jgi:peptidoglycan hydrolase-like amidase/putative cell wall-binding protein
VSRSLHIRFAAVCLAASLVIALVPGPASADDVGIQAIPSFTFSGTGWGHGIGMSQYGARGSALAGKDYRWILGHYYSGTTLGTRTTREPKVNLDSGYHPRIDYPGRPYWTVKSVGSKLKVWRTSTFDPTVELAADTWYRFRTDGTNVIVSTEAGVQVASFNYNVWAGPAGSPGLLEIKEKSTSTDGAYHSLDANGWPTNGFPNVRYRGKIWMKRIGIRLGAINQLPMDHYLYGVVPREMPASWGDATPEALKAQAVAARSYAYADVTVDKILACTTHSQVYKGHSRVSSGVVVMHEDSRSNKAVGDTSGQYILSGSAVATGYFFSQSGGHTANNEDVWVTGDAVSYLRGVPDPYEYLANPPYSPWPADKEKTLTGLQLADKLRGLAGVPPSPTWVTGIVLERGAGGYVRYVTFRFSNGASARISGDMTRSRLGLLSTNFTPTGFPIERIQGTDRYATAVTVAQNAFPSTAPAVVLASGEAFPDALAGSALAGAAGGPLLLTRKASLTSATAVELGQLQPSKVYIMGGAAAVSTQTVEAVQALLPGAIVERVEGANRYETAYAAAELVYAMAGSTSAIVVNGEVWPDAASASALAYAQKTPILLTLPDALGEDATAYLGDHTPVTTLLIGGTAVLSEAIETDVLEATGRVPTRLKGANRYETSAAVARYTIGTPVVFTYNEVYIATGEQYADALTGGTLAGFRRKPLLLTQKDTCPAGTAAFLTERKTGIERIYLFGGTAAISEAGAKAIDDVMMR